MAKKKKQVTNKRHMKKNVRDLIIFIVILTILGLIFMNFLFTFFLIFGIILILLISNWFSKKKKKSQCLDRESLLTSAGKYINIGA